MDVGPRYNVGSSNPSKLFGSMLLLIFTSGDYLRSVKSIAVTHSEYGFIPRRETRSISSRGPIEVSVNLLNFRLERVY